MLVAGAKVQTAIETSLGIQIGTTETVNAERTLETPADSISVITLQWEEVWSTGNVNIIDDAGNLKGEVPFRVLTTLRLSQKSVEEVPCNAESTPVVTKTATITQIPPTETTIPPSSTPSPTNTATIPPTPIPTSTLTPTPPPAVETIFDKYLLSLQSCEHESGTVSCTLLISNEDEVTRSLSMVNGGNVRFIDSHGNEYRHSEFCIGTECGYGLYSGIEFPPNIPLRATIEFRNVPPSASQIAILEIITWDYRFQLKDIPIIGTTQESLENQNEAVSTTTVDNYVFSVSECEGTGETIECFISITNESEIDRVMSMVNGGRARIIDSNGNEYNHNEFAIGKATGYELYSGVYLVAGIPVNSLIKFTQVPPSVTNLSLLEITTWDFSVQLRDILISR